MMAKHSCTEANAAAAPLREDVDNHRALSHEARRLAQHLDGTAEQLLALTYAGYRAWAKNRRLHFPQERQHTFRMEILRYCAEANLIECPPFERTRTDVIEEALDAFYPRYARSRREPSDGRQRWRRRATTRRKNR